MTQDRTRNRFWETGIVVAIVVITFALYARAVAFDFINFDDNLHVTENPVVLQGLTVDTFIWAWTRPLAVTWQPLTALSHLLDVSFFGTNPAGHHLVNVIWHALTAGMLFLALRRLTGEPIPSLVVTMLFAVHPLRVESVAWISERRDVLSGFLFMLTLWLYAGYARRASPSLYLCVFISHAAGLLAKSMVVTLPCVLLLLDYWPLRRITDRASAVRLTLEKLPLFGLSFAVGIATIITQQRGGALASAEATPALTRILGALAAYGIYLKQLIVPTGLAIFYPQRSTSELILPALAAGLVLTLLSVAAIRTRRERPYLLVGWLWYLGMLAPVIGLIQVGAQAHADRYTYLPHIGLLIGIVWTLKEIPFVRSRPAVAVVSLGVVLLLLAGLTWCQLGFWRDSERVFGRALAVTEGNARAHDYYAQALVTRGNTEEAIAHFIASIELEPGNPQPRHNLAMTYQLADESEKAREQMLENISLFPRYAPSYRELGVIALIENRDRTAEMWLQSALDLRPDDVKARINLGIALARQDRMDEAGDHLRIAVRLDPRSADARYNLALVRLYQGDREGALRALRETLEIDPDHEAARRRLEGLQSNPTFSSP